MSAPVRPDRRRSDRRRSGPGRRAPLPTPRASLRFVLTALVGFALLCWGTAGTRLPAEAALVIRVLPSVLVLVMTVARVRQLPQRRRWVPMLLGQLLILVFDGVLLSGSVASEADWASRSLFGVPVRYAGFGVLVGGLGLLLGARLLLRRPAGRERGDTLDALIATVSGGSLLVVLVVLPRIEELTTDAAGAAVLGAVLVHLLTLWVLTGPVAGFTRHSSAIRWTTVSVVAAVLADVTRMQALGVDGTGVSPHLLQVVVLAAEVCAFGSRLALLAAARAPEASTLGSPVARRDTSRVPLLVLAALVCPVADVVSIVLRGDVYGIGLSIAAAVVAALVLLRTRELLRVVTEQSRRLSRLADTDALTGLPNRRSWDAVVAAAVESARDRGHPLSVALVDLDWFKAYNDEHGHDGGDALLREVATMFADALPGVFVARWGGEEFVVLLPGVGSVVAGRRLRAVHAGIPQGQTCSIGLAVFDGHEDAAGLLTRADAALYRAKENGRDRTETAPAPASTTTPTTGAGATARCPMRRMVAGFTLVGLAVVAYLLTGGPVREFVYLGTILLTTVLLTARLRELPRWRRWLPLTAASWLFLVGACIESWLDAHGIDGTPSPADWFYMVGAICAVVAVPTLVPIRDAVHRRQMLLDAAILVVSLGVLLAVYVILPGSGLTGHPVDRAIFAFYPLLDLLGGYLLFRVFQFFHSPPWALRWFAASVAWMLLSDGSFLVLAVGWDVNPPSWVQIGWVFAYTCAAGVAMHPSALELGEPPRAHRATTQPRTFVFLAAAMVLPVADVVGALVLDGVTNLWLSLGSAVVLGLVLLRIADLLRLSRAQAVVVAALAETDALTGLPNRRAWDARVHETFCQARRDGSRVAVAIVDLDHFKLFNDAHGHDQGDVLLRSAAAAFTAALPDAFVVRWGGEEFTVLLPGVDLDVAVQRLRAVHQVLPGGQTCSIGVADSDGDEEPLVVLTRADEALYRAKAAGRDRTVAAGADEAGGVGGGPTTAHRAGALARRRSPAERPELKRV